MDRKVLNIDLSDAMQINPNLALILSHNMRGWFLERYINIFMCESIVDYIDNVNYAGIIKQYREYSYDEVLKIGLVNIIEAEISNVETDCFLHMWVDEFEMPQSIRYRKSHYVHPLTIYGFDKTKRIFNSIFFDVNKGQIALDIPYDILNSAFLNVEKYWGAGGSEETILRSICCCGYIPTVKGEFHLDEMITQLNNYLFCHNNPATEWYTLSRKGVFNNTNIVYGINVYLELIKKIKQQLNGSYKVPFKSVHDFVMHKKYMFDRLVYVSDVYEVNTKFSSLLCEFKKNYELLNRVRLLNMKTQIKNGQHPQTLSEDKLYLSKLIMVLEDAYHKEIDLMPQIIKSLISLKYEKGYLDRFHVISLIKPKINNKEHCLEFNLDTNVRSYRIDIVRNNEYQYISSLEYITVNETLYYLEHDKPSGSSIRTINILQDSVENVKIYTDTSIADYSINVFFVPVLSRTIESFKLKINEEKCIFNDILNVHYTNAVTFNIAGKDPHIIWQECDFDASEFKYLHIKMKVMADTQIGQIFFATNEKPYFCPDNSIDIIIDNNGHYKSYFINMTQNANWTGKIRMLRFDPLHYTKDCNWVNNIERACSIETMELSSQIIGLH